MAVFCKKLRIYVKSLVHEDGQNNDLKVFF